MSMLTATSKLSWEGQQATAQGQLEANKKLSRGTAQTFRNHTPDILLLHNFGIGLLTHFGQITPNSRKLFETTLAYKEP